MTGLTGVPPEHLLASYGTLAPGRHNHHQLDGLVGEWHAGTVRGVVHQVRWSGLAGYPGLVLDADGPEVRVALFASADLPGAWPRLDAFEGPGYRRVPTAVTVGAQIVVAQVYELVHPPRAGTA